jgi:signal transduction histidine kinase
MSDEAPDARRLRHDIRGEATAIAWAARSLLGEAPPAEQVERLSEIARAAERIEQLVDAQLR